MAVLMSFLLEDTSSQPDDIAHVKKVSDFHGSIIPIESMEPPIRPQKIVGCDPMIVQSEARLHKRLGDRMKGIFSHLVYLGMLSHIYKVSSYLLSFERGIKLLIHVYVFSE